MEWGGNLSLNNNNGDGTIFKISTDGTITNPVVFNGTDGGDLQGSLIVDAEGNMYGTTSSGGEHGDGTIFKVSPDGTFTTLASFDGSNGDWPVCRLTMDAAGNLYGTTELGGEYGDGAVFELSTDGTLSALVSFDRSDSSGWYPVGDLAADSSGDLYGMTAMGGGSSGYGAIFEITDSGFVNSVPEPASLSFIAVASTGLLIRRRRSGCC